MKEDIHPTYYKKVIATCACGATYEIGSTLESITTEICAACHPFYTGKQKLLDTAGQVDKFMAKVKKANKAKDATKAAKLAKEEEFIPTELLVSTETPKAELVESVSLAQVKPQGYESEPKVEKVAKVEHVEALPQKEPALVKQTVKKPAKKVIKKPAMKKKDSKAAKKVVKKPIVLKKVVKKSAVKKAVKKPIAKKIIKKPLAKKAPQKNVKVTKKVTKKKTSKK